MPEKKSIKGYDYLFAMPRVQEPLDRLDGFFINSRFDSVFKSREETDYSKPFDYSLFNR
ncbi:MAG: hypothetical protein KKD48_05280 [Nanoarchaeota archaeon]|nr:hypothetical protein [Nanoarchaeota archaeon]